MVTAGASGDSPLPVNAAATEPKNDLQAQVVAVIEAVVKVVDTISALKDSKSVDPQGDEAAIPEDFLCPLSKKLMRDPVIVATGQTYDRSAIEQWLRSGGIICPETGKVLSHVGVTPNDLVRKLIVDWCKQHGKPAPVQQSISTPIIYIDRDNFALLHAKLSSTSTAEQKEAAKELRAVATDRLSFRELYTKSLDVVPQLLTPLSQSDGDPDIDLELEEDLITILMIISIYDKVKKVIAETPNGLLVLIKALQSVNIETQRNAASTIFQLTSLDYNKVIIGETNMIWGTLAKVLSAHRSALFLKDVCWFIFRLCQNNENKARAADSIVLAALEKIKLSECVDIILKILASLSTVKEGISKLEHYSYYCHHLFRIIRESLSAEDKENGIVILYNVFSNGSKWKEVIQEEEVTHGTISEIARNGTSRAKRKANEILEGLGLTHPPETRDLSSFLNL